MKVHHCSSSEAANILCQTGKAGMGDIFIVESERIVGVADAWPFAVTIHAGALHSIDACSDATRRQFAASIVAAERIAKEIGRKRDPQFDTKSEAIATANAYLNNAALPNYTELVRLAASILYRHPDAGTERESDELTELRQVLERIPCIEHDPAGQWNVPSDRHN
jgi:hypothetical protein